jgi:hypothetical protein
MGIKDKRRGQALEKGNQRLECGRLCLPRPFRGIDRWKASDYHRERLRALRLPSLRLHDSRHHWAVENLRAGVPVELVARRLGHRDATMVLKVYGRFIPHEVEWTYWRERLAERQASKLRGHGAAGGAASRPEPQNPHEKSPATPWDREASDDSRGGTRTRDPGIMRKVAPLGAPPFHYVAEGKEGAGEPTKGPQETATETATVLPFPSTHNRRSAVDSARLRSRVLDVTPEMATAWLEAGMPNHSVSDQLVEAIARDMKQRRWELSGEPIVRSDTWKLLD